jgi:hypothetical protein
MVIPGNPCFHAGIDVFAISVWKRGDPISIRGFLNPRYHTVIPGNPRIGMGIDVVSIVWKWGVPVPIWGFVNPRYHTVKVWFLGQNFRWRTGAPVTQGKAKTPIPITIRGVPVSERARGQNNSYRLVWAKKVSLAAICLVAGSASFGIQEN